MLRIVIEAHSIRKISYAVVLNSCIDIDSTTSPRKQCFCAFGFFGQTCEKESGISDRAAVDDLSGYESRQLNDDATMYWKVLEDSREIEVVVKVRFRPILPLPTRLAKA